MSKHEGNSLNTLSDEEFSNHECLELSGDGEFEENLLVHPKITLIGLF